VGYCTHVGLMVPLTWCRQHGVDRLVPLNSRVVLKPAVRFLRTKVNVVFQGWDGTPARGAVPRHSGLSPGARARNRPRIPRRGTSPGGRGSSAARALATLPENRGHEHRDHKTVSTVLRSSEG